MRWEGEGKKGRKLPLPHHSFFGSRPISRAGKISKIPFLGLSNPTETLFTQATVTEVLKMLPGAAGPYGPPRRPVTYIYEEPTSHTWLSAPASAVVGKIKGKDMGSRAKTNLNTAGKNSLL